MSIDLSGSDPQIGAVVSSKVTNATGTIVGKVPGHPGLWFVRPDNPQTGDQTVKWLRSNFEIIGGRRHSS